MQSAFDLGGVLPWGRTAMSTRRSSSCPMWRDLLVSWTVVVARLRSLPSGESKAGLSSRPILCTAIPSAISLMASRPRQPSPGFCHRGPGHRPRSGAHHVAAMVSVDFFTVPTLWPRAGLFERRPDYAGVRPRAERTAGPTRPAKGLLG
jgi:hypothetical protein